MTTGGAAQRTGGAKPIATPPSPQVAQASAKPWLSTPTCPRCKGSCFEDGNTPQPMCTMCGGKGVVPQVAQASAEAAPVEGCGCESCVYCHDNHDEMTNCRCRCSFDEPAPTPSEGDPPDWFTEALSRAQSVDFTRRVAAVVLSIAERLEKIGGWGNLPEKLAKAAEEEMWDAEAAEEMAK